MCTQLIFLRRTKKEIELFGGEVYIDIDGRNVCILEDKDIILDINPGVYKIKMYKSHLYGSYIGIAESDVDIKEEERLLVRYSPPMIANQAGNIIISEFKSFSEIENIAFTQEQKIIIDESIEKVKKQEQEEKSKNGIIIFVIISVISAILIAIEATSY